MLIALIVIAVIVIGLIGFVIAGFNKLRTLDIGAQEALGVITLNNPPVNGLGHATRLGVTDGLVKANADAALDKALVQVNAVAEAYPDLKANQNFLDLQRQLAETEDQIAFARQYYNDAVTKLNTAVQTIPWMFFSGIAGVTKREFYQAEESPPAAAPPAPPAAPPAPPAAPPAAPPGPPAPPQA